MVRKAAQLRVAIKPGTEQERNGTNWGPRRFLTDKTRNGTGTEWNQLGPAPIFNYLFSLFTVVVLII